MCCRQRDMDLQVSTHMPLARHDVYTDNSVFLIVSTHMPLARHDAIDIAKASCWGFLLTCLLRGMTAADSVAGREPIVSTHMPLARHDGMDWIGMRLLKVSTHMPLARHDTIF